MGDYFSYIIIGASCFIGVYTVDEFLEQAEIIVDLWVSSENKKLRITYKPEVENNTPSYLFSMEKAKRNFGYVPKYSNFRIMMEDYKKDLEANKYQELFNYVK